MTFTIKWNGKAIYFEAIATVASDFEIDAVFRSGKQGFIPVTKQAGVPDIVFRKAVEFCVARGYNLPDGVTVDEGVMRASRVSVHYRQGESEFRQYRERGNA